MIIIITLTSSSCVSNSRAHPFQWQLVSIKSGSPSCGHFNGSRSHGGLISIRLHSARLLAPDNAQSVIPHKSFQILKWLSLFSYGRQTLFKIDTLNTNIEY